MPKQKTAHTILTEARVKEITEDLLRTAIREQSRDLERHLTSIHERLVELEKSKRSR